MYDHMYVQVRRDKRNQVLFIISLGLPLFKGCVFLSVHAVLRDRAIRESYIYSKYIHNFSLQKRKQRDHLTGRGG